ncbi:hypothetical protein BGX27_011155 [Mortierella sp. AM989]|nr:hypothetical protein BGX27_011155 [Mortierella sp. AM989]
MPSTDSMMQPISAPIPVPGTQQEPTMPSLPTPIDTNTVHGTLSGTSNISPTTLGGPRTSLSGTRASTISNGSNNSPSGLGYGNNANSGLRRFPSFGNTNKLSSENITLKAKITELDRYLTGVKEELIKANAQKLKLKTDEERNAITIKELREHIQKCEFELGAKIVECEALHIQMAERARVQQQELEKMALRQQDKHDSEVKDQEKNMSKSTSDLQERDDKIKVLMQENVRKDAVISELLEKVDRLGTEVLNLEREKAHLERSPSLAPADADADSTAKETDAVAIPDNTSTVLTASSSLKDLVPITAEAIIAATTPFSTVHNPASQSHTKGVFASQSDNSLNTSTSTSPSTIQSEDQDNAPPMHGSSSTIAAHFFVNSVGYNVSQEHPKLLVKFQALRMQQAQTSEYLELLESENRELKVQLLDVSSGYDTSVATAVAH